MYLFIINNHSGKGTKVWKKILPLLEEWNIEYKPYFITKPEEMLELNLDINSLDPKALVVVGGDGTIHHALKYIENTAIPIGIIPAGSGNDFARALNIPKNSHLALLKILEGKIQNIDLIKVNNQSCATVVGVGFDANVAQLVNQSKIKQWLNYVKLGNLAYVIGVLKGVFSYTPKDIVITIDGKKKQFSNVWLIAIANTPYYGGGLKICPEADNTDGTLNLCIAHSLSKFEILMFFPLVFLGKHTLHRSVSTEKGQAIEISSNDSVLVQADGEMLDQTPISIFVQKQKFSAII